METSLMATPRIAAGALIRDGLGRILLVRPTYKAGWDLPGGYVEVGESPAAACTREVLEEIGLVRPAGRLLAVDWAPHPAEGDKLLFIFDGGELTEATFAALVVDGVEISAAEFHQAGVLQALMPERLSRRLHTALAAAHQGTTAYAEHGQTPQTPQTPRDHANSRTSAK
jgi:8-oxo-dGTP diphosphatase